MNNSTRYIMSTRRETVIPHFQTRRKELKMRHARRSVIATRLTGASKCGKTMSRIFYLSFQSKLRIRRIPEDIK